MFASDLANNRFRELVTADVHRRPETIILGKVHVREKTDYKRATSYVII